MISWTQENCKKTKLNDNVCSRRPVTKTELSRAMLTMLIRSAPSGVASESLSPTVSKLCQNRAIYYKGGPSPPTEISMGRAGLKIDRHKTGTWTYRSM